MKKIIARILIITALVLTSINVCFPNEIGCSDNTSSSSVFSPLKTTSSDNGSQESHHCFGLSCNTWMISFSSTIVQSNFLTTSLDPFSFNLSTYPIILLSMDKPPTV